jgi:FtsZ-binding cell division protein ZapB
MKRYNVESCCGTDRLRGERVYPWQSPCNIGIRFVECEDGKFCLYEDAEKEIEKLKEQNVQLKNESVGWCNQFKFSQEQLGHKLKQIEGLECYIHKNLENENLKEQNSSLNCSVIALQKERYDLLKRLDELRTENDQLAQKNYKYFLDFGEIRDDKQHLYNIITALQKEREELRERLDKLQIENSAKLKRIDFLHIEKGVLSLQLARYEKSLEDFESIREENTKLKEQNAQLNCSVSALRKERFDLSNNLEYSYRNIRELRDKVKILEGFLGISFNDSKG